MWGLAVIICLIGIIGFFIFIAKQMSKEYLPIKMFLWLCVPLLINVGLYFCYKMVLADFSDGTAEVFSSLFQVGLGLMIFVYVYMLGWGILKWLKNVRDKKYLERMMNT